MQTIEVPWEDWKLLLKSLDRAEGRLCLLELEIEHLKRMVQVHKIRIAAAKKGWKTRKEKEIKAKLEKKGILNNKTRRLYD
jgi:hypothetical protein